MISLDDIRASLPQSYPFLLIDAVEEVKEGESLVAIKNITANEWPFAGRSAGNEHFPETLVIEAAAQAALLFYRCVLHPTEKNLRYFIGKVEAEFCSQVYVGDCVRMRVFNCRMFGRMGLAAVDVSAGRKVADVKFIVGTQ